MIVSASSRTDIPAFYTEWFMNRLRAGFFDVRNPFYPKKVSRIRMENVDAFMFCTKNPMPLEPYLSEIERPVFMDVTITPYHRDLEPGVPDKTEVVECVKRLSEKLGADHVAVRYDPVLLSPRYTVDYHLRAFERLCSQLEGKVAEISVSVLDLYRNVQKNAASLRLQDITEEDLKRIGQGFAASAAAHHIHVFTCHEGSLLEPYGISPGACFSRERAFEMTGKTFGLWKARDCGCVEMADVGEYNTCAHFCRYCYANFDEGKIRDNMSWHDPSSSLLVGHLHADDEITERKK